MLPQLQNSQFVDNSSPFICRFLADRFVEGTCPFCNYEVILEKTRFYLILAAHFFHVLTEILGSFNNGNGDGNESVKKAIVLLSRPVAGGGAGGARAPPEIVILELNSATKVEFFY